MPVYHALDSLATCTFDRYSLQGIERSSSTRVPCDDFIYTKLTVDRIHNTRDDADGFFIFRNLDAYASNQANCSGASRFPVFCPGVGPLVPLPRQERRLR